MTGQLQKQGPGAGAGAITLSIKMEPTKGSLSRKSSLPEHLSQVPWQSGLVCSPSSHSRERPPPAPAGRVQLATPGAPGVDARLRAGAELRQAAGLVVGLVLDFAPFPSPLPPTNMATVGIVRTCLKALPHFRLLVLGGCQNDGPLFWTPLQGGPHINHALFVDPHF